MFKIAFVNKHTHKSDYLINIEGDDYLFETFKGATKALECLSNPMKNGRFVLVEQYHNGY